MITETEKEVQGKPAELLADLRSIIDQREELARQDRELSGRKAYLERKLLAYHETTGIEKITSSGMSVSFNGQAMRARYDPEKWIDIVKWAVDTNNLQIIQRSTSDAKIVDLVVHGTPLPEGLTLENYVKISCRRV